MNRRGFLGRIVGAMVAAKVAPIPKVAAMLPAGDVVKLAVPTVPTFMASGFYLRSGEMPDRDYDWDDLPDD